MDLSNTCISLVGVPYEELDCWGVVVKFYKKFFDIELAPYYSEVPDTAKEAERLVKHAMSDFEKVNSLKMKVGDIVLIKLLGYESHIAVYLGAGKILHTQHKTGCVVDSLSRWEKMVVGVYRTKER
jgi:cell wall-associated NlpC family hydrolase